MAKFYSILHHSHILRNFSPFFHFTPFPHSPKENTDPQAGRKINNSQERIGIHESHRIDSSLISNWQNRMDKAAELEVLENAYLPDTNFQAILLCNFFWSRRRLYFFGFLLYGCDFEAETSASRDGIWGWDRESTFAVVEAAGRRDRQSRGHLDSNWRKKIYRFNPKASCTSWNNFFVWGLRVEIRGNFVGGK